ncbi:MAG: polyprenyl synthetase family protein [Gemmatimonadetes bacterium]|nr:polyprenyl synthetase family protein [Gemmatimonadota bacterium]
MDDLLRRRLEALGAGPLPDAMRYSALAPGKRMRPILALAAFRAAGGAGDAIYGPACALELIHAYSLVHDDLPDFDDDDLRRGRHTSHIVHGEPLALAAGFALLTEGLAWLGEAHGELSRDLLRTVTRAVGLGGMIGGQYLDLLCEGREPEPGELLRIHAGKTGRLIEAAVDTGALVAGADSRVRAGLARYAEALGLAFQIADDLLDALGVEGVTGKSMGTDAAAGKATFVSLYGLDGARRRAHEAAARGRVEARALRVRDDLLVQLADFVIERAH